MSNLTLHEYYLHLAETEASHMSTEKVYILLSGGIDSTTTLALAKLDFPNADFEAVSIDYGQRHVRELEAALAVANHYDIPHHIIDAKGFVQGMLVDKGADNETVPDVAYSDLPAGISPTYVTFRNGLMLSIVAARAQAWVMEQQKHEEAFIQNALDEIKHNREEYPGPIGDPNERTEYNAYIYCGIHADDGANWAYPDCTAEFAGPMAAAIFVGTYNRVRLRTPFTFMSKAMLVQIGLGLSVPYRLTWSCYKGGEKHCGICPTCRSRKEAFQIIKAKDPTNYAQ